jgi:large subunit ribosomal protein L24
VPIPIDDVRLVVPYEITEKKSVYKDGQEVVAPVKYFTDAIVDKIYMERHTTGIDPFTGTDYGDAEIPEEHQYDPQSGLPIFHRYIAGTRERIEWPWEKEEEIQDSGITEESKTDNQTWIRKTLGTLRHPIQSVKRWTSKDTAPVTEAKQSEEKLSEKLTQIEQEVRETRQTSLPRSIDPRYADAYDNTDTTRNIVEGAENMSYTLLAAPYPPSLGDELRSHIQDFTAESRRNKDDSAPVAKKVKHKTERSVIASEIAKAKHAAAQQMKTPMQLRWETEHAKKIRQQKKAPLVSTEELVRKLQGYRRQRKGVKVEEVE